MNTPHGNTENDGKLPARKPPPAGSSTGTSNPTTRTSPLDQISNSPFGDISDSHFLSLARQSPSWNSTPPPSNTPTALSAPRAGRNMGPPSRRVTCNISPNLATLNASSSRSEIASHPSDSLPITTAAAMQEEETSIPANSIVGTSVEEFSDTEPAEQETIIEKNDGQLNLLAQFNEEHKENNDEISNEIVNFELWTNPPSRPSGDAPTFTVNPAASIPRTTPSAIRTSGVFSTGSSTHQTPIASTITFSMDSFKSKTEFAQHELGKGLKALSIDGSRPLGKRIMTLAHDICNQFKGASDFLKKTKETVQDCAKDIVPRSLNVKSSITIKDVLPDDTAELKSIEDDFKKAISTMQKTCTGLIVKSRGLASKKLIADARIKFLESHLELACFITSITAAETHATSIEIFTDSSVPDIHNDKPLQASIAVFTVLLFLKKHGNSPTLCWFWLIHNPDEFDLISDTIAMFKNNLCFQKYKIKFPIEDLNRELNKSHQVVIDIIHQVLNNLELLLPLITWDYARNMHQYEVMAMAEARIKGQSMALSVRSATEATQQALDKTVAKGLPEIVQLVEDSLQPSKNSKGRNRPTPNPTHKKGSNNKKLHNKPNTSNNNKNNNNNNNSSNHSQMKTALDTTSNNTNNNKNSNGNSKKNHPEKNQRNQSTNSGTNNNSSSSNNSSNANNNNNNNNNGNKKNKTGKHNKKSGNNNNNNRKRKHNNNAEDNNNNNNGNCNNSISLKRSKRQN